MDLEETLQNDDEARQWLEEIESFRSPPPPRKLVDCSLVAAEKPLQDIDKRRNFSSSDQWKKAETDEQSYLKYATKNLENLHISTYGSDSSILYAKPTSALACATKSSNSLDKNSIDQLRDFVKKKSRPVVLDGAQQFSSENCRKSNSMTDVMKDATSRVPNDTYKAKFYPADRQIFAKNQISSGVVDSNGLSSNFNDEKAANCGVNGKLNFFEQIDPTMVGKREKIAHPFHTNKSQCGKSNVVTSYPSFAGTPSHRQDARLTKTLAKFPAKIPDEWAKMQNGPSNVDSCRKSPVVVGSQAQELQQHQFLKFEAEIEKQMENTQRGYGFCCECKEKIIAANDATQALGRLYHTNCFTCFSCGRVLTGKKFYEAGGKTYCEEDYLFSGYQQSTERCAVCGHFIMDMILQAVNKSFHPACFRCSHCKESLDGVPFTMDDQGSVYCVADYHRLFAPKCAKCRKPITPLNGRDETVRVVAMKNDYHVDCYTCEGCGLQLTDEQDKRCYPLGDHLLCQACNFRWSINQPMGDHHFDAPITDV